MRDLLRPVGLFLIAVVAMSLAYGAGFGTAVRVSGAVPQAAWAGIGGVVGHGVVGPLVGTDEGTATTEATAGAGEPADFGLFWEAWEQIHTEYYGPLPEDAEFTYGAIRGSLRALDDPYTAFTDPIITEIERPELERKFEGIGAYVTQNKDGQLVIQTPMRGQPAEKAGIMPGDIVIKVDDVDIAGMDTEDAVLLIRGPKGTTVRLTIIREDELEPLIIAVVRDKIDIPSVNEVRLLEEEGAPEVGYLQLTVFATETKRELEREIDRLRQEGARALILDLRNNPGGFLNTAVDVASQFIGSGVIVYQEDKYGNRIEEVAQRGGHALDLPLVVIVNKGSASASEIVAGAVRDHGRGVLVGETTYGKGSVQNVHSLSDNSQLRVTVAQWLTPSGSHIHDTGIEPDIPLERTPEDIKNERDPQLDGAVEAAMSLLESEE